MEAAAAETENDAAVQAASAVAGQTGPALAAGTVDDGAAARCVC